MKEHKFLFKTVMLISLFCTQLPASYTITASTWIGTAQGNAVTGIRIRGDGSVIVAGRITGTTYGVTPTLLNGTTAQSAGTVMTLSPNGASVTAMAKVSDAINDMATDRDGNIYLAAGNKGVIKLDAAASRVLWTREAGGNALRLDAGEDGTVAVLNGTGSDAGRVYVYSSDGTPIVDFAGHRRTQDVAIHSGERLVFLTGFRNANTKANPVQICYIRAVNFQGAMVWNAYDWEAHLLDNSDGVPYGEVKPENNMADTRGYRVSVGRDGRLYTAFESAGGNHIFRYDPFNIMKRVQVVGGDNWHSWHNTRSEHKTFFGRYDMRTGNYQKGQQFCTRLSSGAGNAARIHQGDITADEQGNMYICGSAASGLPIDGFYTPKAHETTFNPFAPSVYTGGSYLLVMDSTFSRRLYCTRLTPGGSSHAVSARVAGSQVKIAWGGSSNSAMMYTTANTLQQTKAHDTLNLGHFALVGNASATSITKPAGETHSSGQTTPGTLTVELAQRRPVRVTAYDMSGRAVATVFEGILEAGVQSIRPDMRKLNPGRVYLFQAETGSGSIVYRKTGFAHR